MEVAKRGNATSIVSTSPTMRAYARRPVEASPAGMLTTQQPGGKMIISSRLKPEEITWTMKPIGDKVVSDEEWSAIQCSPTVKAARSLLKQLPAVHMQATFPRRNSGKSLLNLQVVTRQHTTTNAVSIKSKASNNTCRHAKADSHLPTVNAKAVIWPGIILPLPSETLPPQHPKVVPSSTRKQLLARKAISRDEETSVWRHSPAPKAVPKMTSRLTMPSK
jgi:hypothetical protein